jgi:nucleotide-binding universal stress UspA family protein
MKTIIVAVDFSNATSSVTKHAIEMAQAFGATLELFHAIEPEPSYTAYGFTPDEFPAIYQFHEEARRRAILKLQEVLDSALTVIPSATSHLADGSPLHLLLERIKEKHADFVVVGSHGHGMIASLLLGSVAEGMVRKASVPTLVVPVANE